MSKEIVIAGFGGQGVLFMGKVLAYTGLVSGKNVSWLPSYGPEMRGGTANCHVIISDEDVASPLITNPTTLFAMNLPSLLKFESTVVSGGCIVIDSTLINPDEVKRNDIKLIAIPAAEWAEEMQAKKLANMILLGAYAAQSGEIELGMLENGLKRSMPKNKPELFDMNLKAVLRGYNK